MPLIPTIDDSNYAIMREEKQLGKCGKLFIHTVLAKVIYIYT